MNQTKKSNQPTTKSNSIILAAAHKAFLYLDLNAMLVDDVVVYDVKWLLEVDIRDKK